MFLGTPRKWWIAAVIPLVLSFGLLLTGDGTMLRTAAAVLLLLVAIAAVDPPRPRAPIEGRDPAEV